MSLSFKTSSITSAPVSPQPSVSNVSRSVTGLLSRATSLTGSSIVTNTVQQIARATSQVAGTVIKDRHKILLIIDDHLVDWSKYFRGRRLIGDWDIKVEQAEFKEINITANSEIGTLVSVYTTDRNGYRIVRTFRPDFVLIRQHINDCNANYRNIIIGLKYGLIPSINTLQSFYNFQDKSWIFANLLILQRKHGKQGFPLIEQTFFQSYKETSGSGVPKLPCVIKIGSSSSGAGKVKIDNINQYQDIRSILLMNDDKYCTIEPFIDSKCDLILQKIGTNYKAFTRKSVSGNWKANIGSALLEQIPFNDRYKKWIDDVSDLFGGLDICSLEGVIDKNDNEFIFKVHGSDTTLLGDTQEEDRKNIVELIVQKMNIICKNLFIKQQSRTSISSNEPESFEQSMKRSSITATVNPPTHPKPVMNRMSSKESLNQSQSTAPPVSNRPLPPKPQPTNPPVKPPPPPPPPSSQSSSGYETTAPAIKTIMNETNPFASTFNPSAVTEKANKSQTQQQPPLNKRDSQNLIGENSGETTNNKGEEVDDTMKNLRKTFAGIFGDM